MSFNNFCPNCQKSWKKNSKFCEECGGKLTEIKTTPTPEINAAPANTSISKNSNHNPDKKSPQNYSELTTVIKSMEIFGRLLMKHGKIFGGILLFLGLIGFVTSLTQNIQQSIGILLLTLISIFIFCLPLYITGLILTAIPQTIMLLKDCRDYLYILTQNKTI